MVNFRFLDEEPAAGAPQTAAEPRFIFEDEQATEVVPSTPTQPPAVVEQQTTAGVEDTPSGPVVAEEQSAFGMDLPGGGVQATPEQAGGLPLTTSETGGLVREFGGGLTFEFSDEGEAFARSAFDDRETGEILDDIRAQRRLFREQNPKLSTAANIAGGVAAIALPAGAAARAATGLGKAIRGAGVGAASGGLTGAGAAEGGLEERAEGAARGAGTGAVVGAALPGVAKVAGGFRKLFKAAGERAQTLEQLQNLASAAYRRAEQSGLLLKPDAFRGFINNIGPKAIKELDPELTPKAWRFMKRWEDLADSQVGISSLMTERQLLGQIIRELPVKAKTERRALVKLRQSLDGFMENLGRNTVARGDPKVAQEALKTGNDLYRRFARGEVIDRIVRLSRENAKQGGVDREMRRRFKALIRNEKEFRLFNKAEQKAIRRASRLGVLTGPLAVIGTAAPRGFFSGIGQGATIVASGQPLLLAIPAAGEAARQAVNVAARGRAQRAFETATRTARPSVTQPEQAAVNALLLGQIPEATAQGRLGPKNALTRGQARP